MKKTVRTDFGEIEYELHKKRVKTLRITVGRYGNVVVTAPLFLSQTEIERFILSRQAFLQKAIATAKERKKRESFADGKAYLYGVLLPVRLLPVRLLRGRGKSGVADGALTLYAAKSETLSDAYDRFLREECEAFFPEAVLRAVRRMREAGYAVPIPRLTYRKMTSRWGVCFPKKQTVKFNTCLLKYPVRAIEYVVYHELCHFIYADHSPAFYQVLAAVFPDYAACRRALKEPL